MTNIFIVSLRPLSPVKSGFQNTVHLLNKALKKKLKVGVFPVSEKAWIDIGQWNAYKKTIEEFSENEQRS